MLARDLRLVALTGARYHASIVSCCQSVALIAEAKAAGLPVTCGTTINHLTLNENDIGGYRTFLRLSPPLRGEEERMALVDAVADGIIDVIVSDHNPQDVRDQAASLRRGGTGRDRPGDAARGRPAARCMPSTSPCRV